MDDPAARCRRRLRAVAARTATTDARLPGGRRPLARWGAWRLRRTGATCGCFTGVAGRGPGRASARDIACGTRPPSKRTRRCGWAPPPGSTSAIPDVNQLLTDVTSGKLGLARTPQAAADKAARSALAEAKAAGQAKADRIAAEAALAEVKQLQMKMGLVPLSQLYLILNCLNSVYCVRFFI